MVCPKVGFSMCLILFAYRSHPDYPLVLAANRDEYYRRPTQPLDFWQDKADILAGRDLEGMGTWLGINRNGRWSALTNFRGAAVPLAAPPSRGDLVRDYIAGMAPPADYLEHVRDVGSRYGGFNLVVGDSTDVFYYTNQAHDIHHFQPGIHGISTCLLGVEWPKITRGKAGMSHRISGGQEITTEPFFQLLQDATIPPEDDIPRTGMDRDWERTLSPLFIESDTYGTRSSSVILIEKTGKVTFAERTHVKNGVKSPAHGTREFTYQIGAVPS